MRLLVITPHLLPDTAPTGVVVSAIVDHLGGLGHEVHVVTSLPWYADHRIVDGWRGRPFRRGRHDAATVVRLHPFPTDKSNLAARALGFIGFTGLATMAGLTARGPFDGVIAVSPPLTLGLAGWLVALRHRCPLVCNVQDVFPDVAIQVGAITSPRAIRFFRALERFTYRRSDAVTVLSDDMAANVAAKLSAHPAADTPASPALDDTATRGGNRRPLVRVIPNFVDIDAIGPGDRHTAYRIEHDLGDRIVVMYAGNLGHSQALDLLVGAARRHHHRHDLVYVVNGGGVRADELREAAADLENLVVVGYQPADRVPEVLATADVHVVLLKAGLGASSVPSKTYSAMAAGRPLIASIDEGTEVARVLHGAGAGLAVPPDDLDAFVAAVERLADDPELRAAMGSAGRRWVEEWRSPASVGAAYAGLLEELAERRATPRRKR
ncbi:MAG: glycosyltransferase family 4 protein [Acidimicrobiales bacterium]